MSEPRVKKRKKEKRQTVHVTRRCLLWVLCSRVHAVTETGRCFRGGAGRRSLGLFASLLLIAVLLHRFKKNKKTTKHALSIRKVRDRKPPLIIKLCVFMLCRGATNGGAAKNTEQHANVSHMLSFFLRITPVTGFFFFFFYIYVSQITQSWNYL